MKQIVFFSCLNFFFGSAYSQNSSYIEYQSIISSHTDSNYAKTLERYKKTSNELDPINHYQFMMIALEADDLRAFKRIAKKLISKWGWNYSAIDTTVEAFLNPQMELIHSKRMSYWLLKKSSKLRSKWVRINSEGELIQREIEKTLLADQKEIEALTPFINYEKEDSISLVLKNKLYALGDENLLEVLSLCSQFNTFPNNFEHGYNTFNMAGTIIWHNMKVKESFERTWQLIFPFYEKAYLEGKVDYSLFIEYDILSTEYFGVQKFGFMDNSVPMLEVEKYHERLKKYRFDKSLLKYTL